LNANVTRLSDVTGKGKGLEWARQRRKITICVANSGRKKQSQNLWGAIAHVLLPGYATGWGLHNLHNKLLMNLLW